MLKVLSVLRLGLTQKFIIIITMVVFSVMTGTFYILDRHQERLIISQVENEARAIFRQILITRKWVADHGGIFVERLPWLKPNLYLERLGIKPEIIDIEGKRYIKENPAFVTKELSKYAKKYGLYWFHITSLKLINPENAPDEFEKNSLLRFEREPVKEIISIEKIDNSRYLRYISPLYVEEACLKCHTKQGYRIGDIRGAISVTIPVEKTFAEIDANRKRMVLSLIITLIILVISIYLITNTHVLKPLKRLKRAIKDFSEGKTIGGNIIKTGDEFEEICKSFRNMAAGLREYHNCLNQKIKEATKELEEANKILSEINRKKSDFIAMAAHEFRTPLTSIRSAMDYISAKLRIAIDKNSPEELNDLSVFFDVIKKNSERLIRMVNGMLDIERIESGIMDFHYSSFNLSELIDEVIMEVEETGSKSLNYRTEISDSLYIEGDRERIRQVMMNILQNAQKFSPNNSEIFINAMDIDGWITVEITDHGPGIPIEEQNRIFEKFYKGRINGGTGLGLAISKAIIEAHKGIIGVRSDGKNGSTFFFKIPRKVGKHETGIC